MRTRNAISKIVLSIGAIVLLSLVAQAASDDRWRAEVLAEAMAPLRQAVSIAAMGLHSVSPEDRQVSAHALVNLLEGVDGEHYDSTVDGTLDLPVGLCPHLAQLGSAPEDRGENGRAGLDNYVSMLRLATMPMLAMLDGDLTIPEQTDAFLTTLVLLSSAYADFQDLLQDWEYEIWVRPGESIQYAIDRAWPGAVVTIEPGVYRETLEISDDIAMRGIGGDVIVEPVTGQDGIIIRSPNGDLRVEGLCIRNAATGINVLSGANCLAQSVEILGCRTGIRAAGENSDVRLSDCVLVNNGIALHVLGQASATIATCRMEESTGELASIVVEGLAVARIAECTILAGAGHGIYVHGASDVSIIDSAFVGNALDGIYVDTGSSLELARSELLGNGGFGLRFDTETGSISGSSIDFGSDDMQTANALGAYWPSELTFLDLP